MPANSVHFHHPAMNGGYNHPEAKSTAVSPVNQSGHGSHNHAAGAKSMPASRRGSSGSKDGEELALQVQNLGLHDKGASGNSSATATSGFRPSPMNSSFNPGFLFDEDLDNEMQCTYTSPS
jgi:hypothetical protein